MLIKIIFLKINCIIVLFLALISCNKEESVTKSYLSSPPVLKGFVLRDISGVFIREIGTPNVKYSKNNSGERDVFVINTLLTNEKEQLISIYFKESPKENVIITIVEGTVAGNIQQEINYSNIASSPRGFVIHQDVYTVFSTNTSTVGTLTLPFKSTKGAFRVYIDFGNYVLYDNIIIQ